MKRLLQRTLAAASSIAMLATPFASSAMTVTTSFGPGDLIKGSMDTVYYFASNGKRYVFPNSKTYFTWYANFDTVKVIPDNHLSTVPLGGNVTYRPGRKMVKIDTDPRTYVVDRGGVLRHVTSESLAQTLYGLNWNNQIDDIPDGFFINYRIGTPIETASEYQPENVMTLTTTIAQDKNLEEEGVVTISIGAPGDGFVPSTITVKRGTRVTWTNRDNQVHNVSGPGWNSGDLAYQESYTKIYDVVGSFDYNCSIHPVMQGTINVVN